jgi:hypothetical protein
MPGILESSAMQIYNTKMSRQIDGVFIVASIVYGVWFKIHPWSGTMIIISLNGARLFKVTSIQIHLCVCPLTAIKVLVVPFHLYANIYGDVLPNYPAGKQKCPFFSCEKWTLRGLQKDFAMTSMVAEATARTLSNRDFVERFLHGRL